MGVTVDFHHDLQAMLDELEETYDGRIMSPQGKIIRVMPLAKRSEENGEGAVFHGEVYVTTLMHDEIYQALLTTVPLAGDGDQEKGWRDMHDELKSLASRVEWEISSRGFIIRRGRYVFRGEDAQLFE